MGRNWRQRASGATGRLEDRSVRSTRQCEIEIHIIAKLVVLPVVKLSEELGTTMRVDGSWFHLHAFLVAPASQFSEEELQEYEPRHQQAGISRSQNAERLKPQAELHNECKSHSTTQQIDCARARWRAGPFVIELEKKRGRARQSDKSRDIEDGLGTRRDGNGDYDHRVHEPSQERERNYRGFEEPVCHSPRPPAARSIRKGIGYTRCAPACRP